MSSEMPLPYTEGKFELTQEQITKARTWLESHSKTCPHFSPQTAGWFGSPLCYVFTPCGTGVSVKVRCNCKEELDVTEVEEFL